MWINLDKNVDKIVDFMRNYSYKHPHLGHVCKFGLFDGSGDDDKKEKYINMINSTHIANIFDIEVPIEIDNGTDSGKEVENEKKLEASVRNFHDNFPQNNDEENNDKNANGKQKTGKQKNNKNAYEHIMNSNLFDIPEAQSHPNSPMLGNGMLGNGMLGNGNAINSQLLGDQEEELANEDGNNSLNGDQDNKQVFSFDFNTTKRL